MSFLDELRTQRRRLTPTTTTLTYLDGRKFKLTSSTDGGVEIEKARFGFVVDTKPDSVPAKITDFVYLGSQDCCDPETLRRFAIGSVLSVGVAATAECEDVAYAFVPCPDLPETDLQDVLEESVGFIRDAVRKESNVLVHCNAGVSRSASVIIGYLILVLGFDYAGAYSLVKSARSCIKPNDGFVKQLKKLASK